MSVNIWRRIEQAKANLDPRAGPRVAPRVGPRVDPRDRPRERPREDPRGLISLSWWTFRIYFLFFSARGGGMGSPRCWRVPFLIESRRGGGLQDGRGRRAGRVSAAHRELGGGGGKYFFFGAEMSTKLFSALEELPRKLPRSVPRSCPWRCPRKCPVNWSRFTCPVFTCSVRRQVILR